MSTKPRYSYAPLLSPRHTRLVILHSSNTDNYPINCDLIEVNIDERPIYEALSYTWNNEVPSKPLEINSADGSGPRSLLITTNCARALRLLRKRIGKGGYSKIGLWVDAISINQSSNEERSAQVSMMSEIYKKARNVVVWLGNAQVSMMSEIYKKARNVVVWLGNAQVSMMSEIYKKARNVVVWLGNAHAPPNRRSMLALQLSRPFSMFDQEARAKTRKLRWINKLCSVVSPVVKKIIEKGSAKSLPLFSAPYWTRAWTLQEFPHLSTRILCLNSTDCSILGIVPSTEVLDDGLDIYLHHTLLETNRRQDLAAARPRLLSMNLPTVIALECADPRDKVFALRELFLSVLGGIEVDYNRTVEAIFTEGTRCLILASQNLEPYKIPSWAIDWTGASEGGLYQASDGLFREEMSWYWTSIFAETPHPGTVLPASFSNDGLILKLFGKSFSQVSQCVSDRLAYHSDNRGGAKSFVSVFRKFLREATEKDFTSEAPLGCAVVKLLRFVYSDVSDEIKKAQSQMEVESDVDRLCDLMVNSGTVYSILMRRRRLFVTTDGMIGAGNSDLAPGDLIWNFAGLNMPFIVREQGGHHELISPAIVVGAMRREMWPKDEHEIVPWEIV